MKKILLFASAASLMVSCTQTEFAPENKAELPEGISFQVAMNENPTTRAQWNYDGVAKQHNMFWYAESDKIGIFVKGAKLNSSLVSEWATASVAEYKATKSESRGQFTAKQPDQLLTFNDNDPASFIAVWPLSISQQADGAGVVVDLPTLNAQIQISQEGSETVDNVFMYSENADVTPEHSYNSVGESVDLNFVRPFTVAYFQTKGYDKNLFGVIKSIKLETKGNSENGIDPSKIDYGTAGYLMDGVEGSAGDKMVNQDGSDYDATAAASDITLKFKNATPDGIDWSDNAKAYMAINKVNREELGFTEEKKEAIEVTYTFGNIEIVKTLSTASNWPSTDNAFVPVPALNFNNEPLLVTNETNVGNDRALIINTEDAVIFNGNNVKWNGSDIAPEKFATIIANAKLKDTELAKLKLFTNLKNITLAENTSIPAGTFTQTTLLSINMPKVVTIDEGAFATQTTLTKVILPAYNFVSSTVNANILPATLEELDMSSVDATNQKFPASGLTLAGFSALQTVHVKSGVKLGSSTFKGCEALENIDFNGVTGATVDVVGGNVFDGCVKLTNVAISNTSIPTETFNGCEKLENVNNANGQVIAPTSIGMNAFKGCEKLVGINLSNATEIKTSAFEGCTALVNVDLRKVITMGATAFKGCSKLAGLTEGIVTVLRADALTAVPVSAFENCTALSYVSFEKAESIAADILKGCTGLVEISFNTPFKGISLTGNEFDNLNNVTLFVAMDQEGVNGTKFTLGSQTYTFKNITRNPAN